VILAGGDVGISSVPVRRRHEDEICAGFRYSAPAKRLRGVR